MRKVVSREQHGLFWFVIRLFIVVVMVLVAYQLLSQRASISAKEAELENIEQQIVEQTAKNEELQYNLANGEQTTDAYAEEYARNELGYAMQDEKVFVNIGGN